MNQADLQQWGTVVGQLSNPHELVANGNTVARFLSTIKARDVEIVRLREERDAKLLEALKAIRSVCTPFPRDDTDAKLRAIDRIDDVARKALA